MQAITAEQLASFTRAVNEALGTGKTSAEAVQWLQGRLMLTESGVYDQATVNAVAAWQRNKGYSENAADGIADGMMIRSLA